MSIARIPTVAFSCAASVRPTVITMPERFVGHAALADQRRKAGSFALGKKSEVFPKRSKSFQGILRMAQANALTTQSPLQQGPDRNPSKNPRTIKRKKRKAAPRSNPQLDQYPEVKSDVPPAVSSGVTHRVAAGRNIRVAGPGAGYRISAIVSGARERRVRSILIIAPTLSAALRSAAEAESSYPEASIITEAGTGNKDFLSTPVREARRASISVLVGTPRGLCARFTSLEGGKDHMQYVELLVLYDMDYLLDIGWMKELESIYSLVMKRPTQVVVVTDDIRPQILKSIVPAFLPENHETVYWIDKVCQEVIAGADVRKQLISVPEARGSMAGALASLLMDVRAEIAEPDRCKIIVFFPTSRFTQMYAAFLTQHLQLQIHEVHMNKTTRHCGRAVSAFLDESRSVMFSSDMSARGSDINGVDAVIHVCLPKDVEQYKFRNTLLASHGKSIFLLHEYELKGLESLGISVADFENRNVDIKAFSPSDMRRLTSVSNDVRIAAFHSWLGYYSTKRKKLGWTPQEVVDRSIPWSRNQALLKSPPAVTKKTVDRLFLRGTHGLKIETESPGASKQNTKPKKKTKQ